MGNKKSKTAGTKTQNGHCHGRESSRYCPPKTTPVQHVPGQVPTVTMYNGVTMPMIGLGTWEANNAEELKSALRTAIEAGYRHIDTAYFYGNEAVIGELIEELIGEKKITRADLFICTKLPPFFHRPDDARACIETQLKLFRTNYIDLYLMHTPFATKKDPKTNFQMFTEKGEWVLEDVPFVDTWKIFEEFYQKGYLRAIGISNFHKRQIRELFQKATIKPMNHQIEVNILFPQHDLVKYSKRMGMTVTGFSCIGSPGRHTALLRDDWPEGNCLTHPIVNRLAEKHNRTAAQILLRFVAQRNIVALIKSTNPERIKANFQIFDFELDADDMDDLESIKERVRLFPFGKTTAHKDHPFDDIIEKNGPIGVYLD
ncbi:Protein T08H10.1 [Aphelenchoides avenae]|nr:Protein T08H10.1 [Aphelenchus avenae]